MPKFLELQLQLLCSKNHDFLALVVQFEGYGLGYLQLRLTLILFQWFMKYMPCDFVDDQLIILKRYLFVLNFKPEND